MMYTHNMYNNCSNNDYSDSYMCICMCIYIYTYAHVDRNRCFSVRKAHVQCIDKFCFAGSS